jgi:hypothetical protein
MHGYMTLLFPESGISFTLFSLYNRHTIFVPRSMLVRSLFDACSIINIGSVYLV